VPPRAWRPRLNDIEQSTTRIATCIEGLDLAEFSGDQKTVDAVVHNLQIIGEAAINLPETIANRYPAVPWANIGAMRQPLAFMGMRKMKDVSLDDEVASSVPPWARAISDAI
jgi:uncharacterized protein with HEPN domain